MDKILSEESISSNKIKMLRYYLNKTEKNQYKEDYIAVDEAVCIFINDEYYTTLIASPSKINELVIGHLICEGIIKSTNDIRNIDLKPPKAFVNLFQKIFIDSILRNRVGLISTACGQSKSINTTEIEPIDTSQKKTVKAEIIFNISNELNKRGKYFHQTGGTHSAMLSSFMGEVLFFAEDVGRHNAIDKVIGLGAMNKYDMKNCILFCSGRLSSDIMFKVARSGIPIIASIAAPLESGINIAETMGITLISFVRGKRMNIYTHKERIILK